MPIAEILSQGDEVVTGQIADTNAAFLAEQLNDLGFHVSRHNAVGDELSDLVAILREISERADVCVCSGGLGPTDDDYTTRAAAEAFGRPLAFDDVAMGQIEAIFAKFNRPMAEINRRQAWFPTGAVRIDNAWGTAPGFTVEHGRCLFIFMPGVPREMKPMFSQMVSPPLRERFALKPGRLITIKTTGIGESEMQVRAGVIDHPGVTVGTRTVLPENFLKLRFAADVSDDEVRDICTTVAARIGSPVFGIDGLNGRCGGLAEVTGQLLIDRNETLAVAESCTGGRLSAMCTSISGSGAWFLEGVVTYSNAAKVRVLGVSETSLAEYGAVSEQVAREMADGLRARSGATYALAITGLAGPDGGSAEKPVGTVHLALASPSGTEHRLLRLGGDRNRIQDLSAAGALDVLRRSLQGRS